MDQQILQPLDRVIRVVIVDDHKIFIKGVLYTLDLTDGIEVVGPGAEDGEQAIQIVHDLQPDVAIIDINIPLINGIQVTRRIASERHPTRVIVLTGYDDAEQAIHAIQAGAAAYCVKGIRPEKLVEVIYHVYAGRYVIYDRVFDKAGIERWLEETKQAIAGPYYGEQPETFSPLSSREMQILECVIRGLSNKEIARALGISHQTVKNHMTSILKKLAVEDRTQAAVAALQRGWVRLKEMAAEGDVKED